MTVARHIPEDDLALFALAMMQPEEAAFTVAHLRHCDQCRSEVARLQGDLVTYAMTAEMHAPAPDARERLLRTVAKERKFLPPPEPLAALPAVPARNSDLFEPQPRYAEPRRSSGWFGWAGWAIAVGLAAVSGWQFYQGEELKRTVAVEGAALEHSSDFPPATSTGASSGTVADGDVARAREVLQTLTDPTAMQVTMQYPFPHKTEKPGAHAAYVASTGNLIFVASHLHSIPSSRTYELWLLPATGDPIPAGLFRPDANGNASVVLPPLPKNIPAKGFGVTVEADGGSRRPTSSILLAGS